MPEGKVDFYHMPSRPSEGLTLDDLRDARDLLRMRAEREGQKVGRLRIQRGLYGYVLPYRMVVRFDEIAELHIVGHA